MPFHDGNQKGNGEKQPPEDVSQKALRGFLRKLIGAEHENCTEHDVKNLNATQPSAPFGRFAADSPQSTVEGKQENEFKCRGRNVANEGKAVIEKIRLLFRQDLRLSSQRRWAWRSSPRRSGGSRLPCATVSAFGRRVRPADSARPDRSWSRTSRRRRRCRRSRRRRIGISCFVSLLVVLPLSLKSAALGQGRARLRWFGAAEGRSVCDSGGRGGILRLARGFAGTAAARAAAAPHRPVAAGPVVRALEAHRTAFGAVEGSGAEALLLVAFLAEGGQAAGVVGAAGQVPEALADGARISLTCETSLDRTATSRVRKTESISSKKSTAPSRAAPSKAARMRCSVSPRRASGGCGLLWETKSIRTKTH